MQKEHNIFGEIRSARERGEQVEALQCFLELPPEQRADYAAMVSLSPEQLDGIERAVEYLAKLAPDADGKRDARAVEAALWGLEKQPVAWAKRCELALREALEALEGWELLHEAAHVAHYVIDTDNLYEFFDLEGRPVSLVWGIDESRWFEPCEAGEIGVVKRVIIERDELTRQLAVALPCAGRWCVWKQQDWAVLDAARS